MPPSRNPFEASSLAAFNLVTPFDSERFKKSYTDWAICEDLSFRQATSSRTRDLIKSGGPAAENVLPSSPTTLRNWIMASYESRLTDIKNMLVISRSKIHLSFDLWSSSNHLTLCGVVAHFVDENGYVKTALLGLPRLLGTHSGENIAGCVAPVIRKYGIDSKLGYFVMDNAENNDTCIRTLAQWLDINEKKQRLRCAGHIINLVVKAMLFGKGIGKFLRELGAVKDADTFKLWRTRGPIGKLHNIVKYINRSDQRRQEFLKEQATVTLPNDEIFEYELVGDGGIRWNSTYYMIRRAIKLRSAIDLYIYHWQKSPLDDDAYDLSKDQLSLHDWAEINRFAELLQPFEKMTKRLEGNAHRRGQEGSHGAVWEVLEAMDYLNLKLEAQARAVQDEDESYYKTGIDLGYHKLQKYYALTDRSPVYRAAIVLHPAHKESYFEDKWSKWPQWIKRMRIDVRKFYLEYVEEFNEEEESEQEQTPLEEKSDDEFEQFQRSSAAYRANRNKRRKVIDELERYLADDIDEDILDPLAWWRSNAKQYPVLARMAFDLFSIPAMSSECERVFSQSKRLITEERNRLGAATIEADECQKNWLLRGLVR